MLRRALSFGQTRPVGVVRQLIQHCALQATSIRHEHTGLEHNGSSAGMGHVSDGAFNTQKSDRDLAF